MSSEHGEIESFAHAVRERLISFPTMSRRLRLITGLAVAQLLAAGILIAFRDLPMPGTEIVTPTLEGPRPVVVPVPVLVVSAVLLAIAATYLLSGLLHARMPLPLVAAVAATVAGILDAVTGAGGLFASWTALLPLAGIWAMTLFVVMREQRAGAIGSEPSHRREVDAFIFFGILVLVLAEYGLAALRLRSSIPILAFGSVFALQLGAIAYVITPMLLIAGSDFGDFASLTAARASATLARLGAPLLAAATSAAIVAILVFALIDTVPQLDAPRLLSAVLIGCGLIGFASLLLLATRRADTAVLQVPVAAVAAAAIVCELVFQVATPVLVSRSSTAPPATPSTLTAVYTHARAPVFSIRHPDGWDVHVNSEETASAPLGVVFDGLTAGTPVLWFVVAVPQGTVTPATMVPLLVGKGQASDPYHFAAPVQDGAWLATTFTSNAYHGIGWVRSANGQTWLLLAQVTPASRFATESPLLLAMRDSWSPSGTPNGAAPGPASSENTAEVSGPTSVQLLIGIADIVAIAIAVAAAILLLARGARMRRALLASTLFAGIAAAWFFLTQLSSVVSVFGRAPSSGAVHASLPTLQIALAVLSLVVLGVLAARRRLLASPARIAVILATNAGLQFVAWVFGLYSAATAFGETTAIAQATVIVLALLWDVSMSGESITNRDGARVPRHSRVLLFLGYVILVTSALVFFSALHLQNGATLEPVFDAEASAQEGVGLLGVPLVLTLGVLAFWPRRAGSSVAVAGEVIDSA